MFFLDRQGHFNQPQRGLVVVPAALGDLAVRINGESLRQQISRQRPAKKVRRCRLGITRFGSVEVESHGSLRRKVERLERERDSTGSSLGREYA
jgi:hypothetical protein